MKNFTVDNLAKLSKSIFIPGGFFLLTFHCKEKSSLETLKTPAWPMEIEGLPPYGYPGKLHLDYADNGRWDSLAEPALNYRYLGHPIYRFIWDYSWAQPLVIALHRQGDSVWLEAKRPARIRNPLTGEFKVYHPEIKNGRWEKRVDLSLDEWQEFENMLKEEHFWYLFPAVEGPDIDGSVWTFEAHLQNTYRLVRQSTPREKNIREIGARFVKLSGPDIPLD